MNIEIGIIFSIGIFLFLNFFYLFYMSKKTKMWNAVKGKVLSSNIDSIKYVGEDAAQSYKARVEYQYSVNGESYSSKRIFYGDYLRSNMPWRAKKIIKKYAKDEMVTVYYNPQNPKDSVLETGLNYVVYKTLFVSVLFILLAIVIKMNESFLINLMK